jgi:hypothetical protein
MPCFHGYTNVHMKSSMLGLHFHYLPLLIGGLNQHLVVQNFYSSNVRHLCEEEKRTMHTTREGRGREMDQDQSAAVQNFSSADAEAKSGSRRRSPPFVVSYVLQRISEETMRGSHGAGARDTLMEHTSWRTRCRR